MRNETWAQTMKRLRQWQERSNAHASAWSLRQILSDSAHASFIGFCAAKRASNRPSDMTWQEWWDTALSTLSEREAVGLLLDVWNKDVWSHLQRQSSQSSNQAVVRALARSRGAPAPLTALVGSLVKSETPFEMLAFAGFNLSQAESSSGSTETWQQSQAREAQASAAMRASVEGVQQMTTVSLVWSALRRGASVRVAPTDGNTTASTTASSEL